MGIICADLYPVKVDQEPDMGMVCAGVLYPLKWGRIMLSLIHI